MGRRCMIGTLNLGLHTDLELPGPSPELVTIFLKFGQNGVGNFGAGNSKFDRLNLSFFAF